MKIGILGFGIMGSWLAKELAKQNEVAVYDLDKNKTKGYSEGKVLSSLEEFKEFKPEIMINAVSLQNTMKAFESVVELLPKGCILCDVASVKGTLKDFYKKAGFEFVSIHPMFGPTFANVDSLENENAVIMNESGEKGKEFFRNFFSELKLNLHEYGFEEHDKMMAYSLTIPFASSMVFAACVDSKAVPGATFRKHMKIAKGLLSEEDSLLSEILFNPNSLEQIEKVTGRLEFLKHVIKGKDSEEARKFFNKLRENIK